MKDKEKQIEEMAKVMCSPCPDGKECSGTWCYKRVLDCANEFYEKGYRKLPKDSVVLSKEEYEDLQVGKDFDYGYHEGYKNTEAYYENFKLPEERKETAEKILNEVNEFFRPFDKKSPIFLDLLLTKLETVVKKFGVAIKE